MITPQCEDEQLERLMNLRNRPKTEKGVKDLRESIRLSATNEIAEKAVSEWIAVSEFCPQPSAFRSILAPLNEKAIQSRSRCSRCNGTGVVTTWWLVTFRRGTWVPIKRERIEQDYTNPLPFQEQVRAFAERIAADPQTPDQDVVSAAIHCSCIAFRIGEVA